MSLKSRTLSTLDLAGSVYVGLWGGEDSYGRQINVAVRADGRAYSRVLRQGPYGPAWTKWTTAAVDAVVEMEIPIAPGEYNWAPAPCPLIAWGFNALHKSVGAVEGKTYRLPKD